MSRSAMSRGMGECDVSLAASCTFSYPLIHFSITRTLKHELFGVQLSEFQSYIGCRTSASLCVHNIWRSSQCCDRLMMSMLRSIDVLYLSCRNTYRARGAWRHCSSGVVVSCDALSGETFLYPKPSLKHMQPASSTEVLHRGIGCHGYNLPKPTLGWLGPWSREYIPHPKFQSAASLIKTSSAKKAENRLLAIPLST